MSFEILKAKIICRDCGQSFVGNIAVNPIRSEVLDLGEIDDGVIDIIRESHLKRGSKTHEHKSFELTTLDEIHASYLLIGLGILSGGVYEPNIFKSNSKSEKHY